MFIIAAYQDAVRYRSTMCSDTELFNNVMLRYVTQALQTNCSNTIFISLSYLMYFTNIIYYYLVMDEADRILNMDFETEVTKILRCIPSERT